MNLITFLKRSPTERMEEEKHYSLTNLRDHSIEAPFTEELKTMTVYIPKLKKSFIIS